MSSSAIPSEEPKAKPQKKLTFSEELDEMMVVARPKGWLTLGCCLGILFLGMVWSVVGTIAIKVRGNAISMSVESSYVVVAQTDGTVIQVTVSEGEKVKVGETIVKVVDPINALAIQQKKEQISLREAELKVFREKIAEQTEAHLESLKLKVESAQFALLSVESSLTFLETDLKSKRRLYDKGILPLPDVERAYSDLQKAKIDIENYKATIASLMADLTVGYRTEDIKIKEDEIFSMREELNRLLLKSTFLDIKTEKPGKVIEVVVGPGDRVVAGQLIASIEAPLDSAEEMNFYACVGGEYGGILDVGLPVEIEVAGIDPKQYGYMLGNISYLSPYPVSQQEILSEVRNQEIVAFLKGNNSVVYSMTIRLIPDPMTISGYKWTSRRGPPWEITTGTVGSILAIIEKRRPIFFILPSEVGPYVQETLPQSQTKDEALRG